MMKMMKKILRGRALNREQIRQMSRNNQVTKWRGEVWKCGSVEVENENVKVARKKESSHARGDETHSVMNEKMYHFRPHYGTENVYTERKKKCFTKE